MIYLELFLAFLEIGAFTFGGGYAMIPLIQAKVEANGWLTQEELIRFIAVSESTPGPLAVNVSTYVGMETGGLIGAFCATLGVVLPSFLIILFVAKCFERFQKSKAVAGAMAGLKPAVIGLIGSAVVTTGKLTFFADGIRAAAEHLPQLLCSMVICGAALWLSFHKKHPVFIILLSAGLGILAGVIFQW